MKHMKQKFAFLIAIILSLIGMVTAVVAHPMMNSAPEPNFQVPTPVGPALPLPGLSNGAGVVHAFYFYANDCPHCLVILEEIIQPMMVDMGEVLDIRLLEISNPAYYEAMLIVESHFGVSAAERSIPTLVMADSILIGASEIRENLSHLVKEAMRSGGMPFPEIKGVDPEILVSSTVSGTDLVDDCETDERCTVDAPLFVAYFYQTGCKECSRVEADLTYLRSQYPQLQISEFNIYDHADLAEWMMKGVDPDRAFQSPALFIGDRVLLGEAILPENIVPILDEYLISGTDPVWLNFDPEAGRQSVVERFENMGWLAVVAAGLVDGINPCAFATLIFFVSYLTLSGRSGKEVLLVGGSFALGVFLAYLAIGLGLYHLLEWVGGTLDIITKIVYIITGIFCLVLAVFSFLDFRKARKGEVGDMLLKLPDPLRKRINATIRQGRDAHSYVLGAFGAGMLISILELACTGQVYLPTIIFVSAIPGMRLQAFLYLILYNILFVLPLVVIFLMVYYGTTSKDLTKFLQTNAAGVKFLMGLVFVVLGGWLLFSLAL